jgi:hypothetical protein
VSADGDLHRASHDVDEGHPEQAIRRLLKVVAVLAAEVATLKAIAARPHPHQSEPEHDMR